MMTRWAVIAAIARVEDHRAPSLIVNLRCGDVIVIE